MQFASSGFLNDFSVVGSASQYTIGRTGGHSIGANNQNYYAAKQFTAVTEMWTAFAFRAQNSLPDAGNTFGQWRLYKGATRLAYLRFNNSNQLEAYVGATLVGTGVTSFPAADEDHHIEIHYNLADAGGIFKVWLDGLLEIDFSGDTKPDTNADFDEIRLYPDAGNGTTYRGYISDIVIQDTGRIYNAKVLPLSPNAAGDANTWTGVYTDVDEKIADDATTKISATSAGLEALFNIENTSGSIGTIQFVQVSGRAQQSGAPPDTMQLAVKTGGTRYDSANISLSTAYVTKHNVWVQNPNTVADWTTGDIDALQIGVVSV